MHCSLTKKEKRTGWKPVRADAKSAREKFVDWIDDFKDEERADDGGHEDEQPEESS